MQSAATFREQSRAFLEQAFLELEAGDLRQASEKGWGAAAQMVKAVAAERGWQHGTHRLLYGVMDRITVETQDVALRLGFESANTLHANFYEGTQGRDSVESYLHEVRTFVDTAEQLLNRR